jgi:hypothetical protein
MKLWFSTSALLLSQYRKFHKLAVENKSHLVYNSLFKQECGNEKAWRLYYTLQETVSKTTLVPSVIREQLRDNRVVLEDYVKGLGTDKHGRTVKIGKFLTGRALKLFEKDPKRQLNKKEGNLLAVISRHPYDVVGSSTGRSWTSCIELDKGKNKRYILEDVKHGTIVAYLVVNTDKNINHPIARVRIIKYFKESNPKEYILVPDINAYGIQHKKFEQFLRNWCSRVTSRDPGNYLKSPVLTDMRQDNLKLQPTSWVSFENYQDPSNSSLYVYNPVHIPNLEILNVAQQEIVFDLHKDANTNWWIGYTRALVDVSRKAIWETSPKILKIYKDRAPLDKLNSYFKNYKNYNYLKLAIEKQDIEIFDIVRWTTTHKYLEDEQLEILQTCKGYILEKMDYSRLTNKQLRNFSKIWVRNLGDLRRLIRAKIKFRDYTTQGKQIEFFVRDIKTCVGFEYEMLCVFNNAKDYLLQTYANNDVFSELVNIDLKTPPPLDEIDKRNLWQKVKSRIFKYIRDKNADQWEARRAAEILNYRAYIDQFRKEESLELDPDDDRSEHFIRTH